MTGNEMTEDRYMAIDRADACEAQSKITRAKLAEVNERFRKPTMVVMVGHHTTFPDVPWEDVEIPANYEPRIGDTLRVRRPDAPFIPYSDQPEMAHGVVKFGPGDAAEPASAPCLEQENADLRRRCERQAKSIRALLVEGASDDGLMIWWPKSLRIPLFAGEPGHETLVTPRLSASWEHLPDPCVPLPPPAPTMPVSALRRDQGLFARYQGV